MSSRCLAAILLLPLLLPARPLFGDDITRFRSKPDAWFGTSEGRRIVDNILSWQNANGGWWKAYDATTPRPPKDDPSEKANEVKGDSANVWHRTSTFDNSATYTELRILSRAYKATHEPKYRDAFDRGLKFIFDAQYPNGGWPQRFPLEDNYGRRITFNDNAMTNVMILLKDIADGKPEFDWIEPDVRTRCRAAFERGLQCVLDCQIKVNGKLTAWCQQHDEKTLEPAPGRAFELAGITGGESTD